jgi:leucyl/phenylalanyl-tRNA---protein transferase
MIVAALPIYLLDDRLAFPDPVLADPATGILAVGGDLSTERLALAYGKGIFPWYNEDETPILWHAPQDRFVLVPDRLHVSRSLRKVLRQGRFEIRYDTAFEQVMDRCAEKPRPGQAGTWLNADMRRAYAELHRQGLAHSAEAWQDDTLVGGLYGVTIGCVFFGESMFADARDASKAAFATLIPQLQSAGYELIDCQVYTEHLASLGAEEWDHRRFHKDLERATARRPTLTWPA